MTDPATPLTAADAVEKALLYYTGEPPSALASIGFIRLLEQDGYTVAAQPSPSREGLAAIEAGTHVPAVDDFGNQYLAPAETPE